MRRMRLCFGSKQLYRPVVLEVKTKTLMVHHRLQRLPSSEASERLLLLLLVVEKTLSWRVHAWPHGKVTPTVRGTGHLTPHYPHRTPHPAGWDSRALDERRTVWWTKGKSSWRVVSFDPREADLYWVWSILSISGRNTNLQSNSELIWILTLLNKRKVTLNMSKSFLSIIYYN